MQMIKSINKNRLPEDEIKLRFSRSSARGGQNVNKVETRVEARFSIDQSKFLSSANKTKLRKFLKNRISKRGDLSITAESERSQLANRRIALKRLKALIAEALKPAKDRIPIHPSKTIKEKRLREKKIISAKKQSRRKRSGVDVNGFRQAGVRY